MKYILIAVAVILVIWVLASIKSYKDPNLRHASKLKMTTKRYNLYKELFDEHQAAMKKYGIRSKEATEIFIKEINPRIPNPNEWRRFCEYQAMLQREKMLDELRQI